MTSKLYFRLGDVEGFTSNKVSNEYEGWTVPIRELLQNSLDASPEGSECKISIYIDSIKTSDIPHIKDYEEVLNKAIETQKKRDSYNSNAEQQVNFITNALNEKESQVLMFVDNGSGMPPEKWNGLLDERSVGKDASSTGSYGAGHLTSYSLSSLRYILYATRYKDEHGLKNLFTGSPILAGHEDDDAERGSKGRILKCIPKDEKKPVFAFPDEFPSFIRPKMNAIEETGSLVAILGLLEKWDVDAEYAIVSNYFHAIAHDGLSITIYSSAGEITISEDKVEQLIDRKKDEKNRKLAKGNILSGRAVYQAWQAVKSRDTQKTITLNNSDKVNVYIKTDKEFDSTIVLIRNGMVIARHDDMLSDAPKKLMKNQNYEPFTAVIDVDKHSAPKLFDLVKGAENPHHNKLQQKLLSNDDEQRLRTLIGDLVDGIKEHLNEIKRDPYILPVFMTAEEHAKVQSGHGAAAWQSEKAKPQSSTKNINRNKKEPVPVNPQGRKPPKFLGRPLESHNAVRYEDTGDKWTVYLRGTPTIYKHSKDIVVFSIYLGEDHYKDAETYLDFLSVEVNNKVAKIVDKTQAELDGLKQGKQYDIVAEVKKPANIGNMTVSLLPILSLKQRLKSDISAAATKE